MSLPETGELPVCRTQGPLGFNDQGDPNTLTCMGDTVGSTGIGDLGDPNTAVVSPSPTAGPSKARLDAIEAKYNEMIRNARGRGYHVAADNLHDYLYSHLNDKALDLKWLRTFLSFQDACDRLHGYYEQMIDRVLKQKVEPLGSPYRYAFSDHFEASVDPCVTKYVAVDVELVYASGTSMIRTNGSFEFGQVQVNNIIEIKGTVSFVWEDDYDFHSGKTEYIPNFGMVSDEDALLMVKYRGAKPYAMYSRWKEAFKGLALDNGGGFVFDLYRFPFEWTTIDE